MNFKTSFYIFCSVIMISALTSCLGDNEETDVILPVDAQITDFYISHDSIPALGKDSVIFSIDQYNGLIYNHDSVRYGVDVKEKVIANFATAAYAVVDITHAEAGDTTIITTGDSLDLRQVAKLRVYSYSGATKIYEVKLNIHKVDPDSVQYARIADDLNFLNVAQTKSVYLSKAFYTYTSSGSSVKLYSSSDAVSWKEETLSGLPNNVLVSEIQNIPAFGLFARTSAGALYKSENALSWQVVSTPYPVKAIFGRVEASPTQIAGYALLVQKDGKNIPAFTSDFATWLYGTEVSADFPVTDYSSVNYNKMSLDRITIIGGKNASGVVQNTVWSTSNGIYWAKLTGNQNLFPVLDGCNAFIYNSMVYLLNGRAADGSYNRVTYISKDGGSTWQPAQSKTYLPEDYAGRYGASVVVKDNYQYIIGGHQTGSSLKDVWKGILNKLSFKN